MKFKAKLDLNGKKALVTGAARGIGRSCAEALCETGASVTLSDINLSLLENTIRDLKAQDFNVDMAELDVGSWKGDAFALERPLRCENLIAWQAVAPDRPGIVWEVKCDDDPAAADAAAAAVTKRLRHAGDHHCIVSSFSREVLSTLRPQLSAIPMALIAEALPEDGVAFCQEHGLEGIHLDGHQVTHESASTVLDAGLALRCYTINDMNDAERLVALGVSMIMTDFPERFLARD